MSDFVRFATMDSSNIKPYSASMATVSIPLRFEFDAAQLDSAISVQLTDGYVHTEAVKE